MQRPHLSLQAAIVAVAIEGWRAYQSAGVAAGRFRGGLFFRLHIAQFVIPPLRDRAADIPLPAEHIVRRVERRQGWGDLSLSPKALAFIRKRPGPGKVRQLENAFACAMLASRGRTILPEHPDAE